MSRRGVQVGWLLGLMMSIGPGCRSFNEGGLRRAQPLSPDSTADLGIRDLISRHNEAAGLVRSVKVSDLSVTVQSYQTEGGKTREPFFANTKGVLQVERPKNLRMILRNPGLTGDDAADIGSNPQEFWMANGMQREILVGRYDQIRADPLSASIQPEWILEVLALQPIASSASIRSGPKPGTYTITERRSSGANVDWLKETVMSSADGRIVEHRLLSADRKTVLAQASVKGYQDVSVDEGRPESASTPPTVSIPRSIVLKLPEVADLSLTLKGVHLNPDEGFAAEAFQRPDPEGRRYAVRDIREMMGEPDRRFAASEPDPSSPVIEVEGPPPRRRTTRSSDPDPAPTRPIGLRSSPESDAPPIPSLSESSRLWETPLPTAPREPKDIQPSRLAPPVPIREG